MMEENSSFESAEIEVNSQNADVERLRQARRGQLVSIITTVTVHAILLLLLTLIFVSLGPEEVPQIVAVTESGDIVPPCGMCRELISDYAPAAHVILEDEGVVRCVPVLELLPEKYDGSKYPNRRKE